MKNLNLEPRYFGTNHSYLQNKCFPYTVQERYTYAGITGGTPTWATICNVRGSISQRTVIPHQPRGNIIHIFQHKPPRNIKSSRNSLRYDTPLCLLFYKVVRRRRARAVAAKWRLLRSAYFRRMSGAVRPNEQSHPSTRYLFFWYCRYVGKNIFISWRLY